MKIAISRCLLGDKVRYDGKHQYHSGVYHVMQHKEVDVIPVCPEVAIGLGVPRPPIHLVGNANKPSLQVIQNKQDISETMLTFSKEWIHQYDLDGVILKSRSPSCGLKQVKVLQRESYQRRGTGIFAAVVLEHLPFIPVREEKELNTHVNRNLFIQQVRLYHVWKTLMHTGDRRNLQKLFLSVRPILNPADIRYFRSRVKYAKNNNRRQVATELLLSAYINLLI